MTEDHRISSGLDETTYSPHHEGFTMHPAREHQTIAILGVGRVGAAIARQAIAAGYRVVVAASGPASDIELIVDAVIPGAVAASAAAAARDADVVVLAVPLHKYRTLPVDALAGKILVDAMNYWAPIDGDIAEFDDDPRTTSEIVQDFLRTSSVVKTLNHIGYHELEDHALPPGSPGRRALAIASDDKIASALVAEFVDRLGYDPVVVPGLAAGAAFAPGTDIFNSKFDATGMTLALDYARTGLPVS
ncbi:NAD(P)-binding domain-containing protein [Rhodococcus oxybenzonivorans]|uniref:NADPH-dependent F420 reductase n=1 Tax=Rhodococcus oxybenzonivorans TaxID=1990687 RepID=UPI00295418E7|nr:NAD(P)-binding domain-containing protein [Rhodococcus oxybenzonivorans]MDV7353675.1 NAD(P)-binding domain-containing protein [Rhodococcus oxybenzonivorans]